MKLTSLTIVNFQSFGEQPTLVSFEALTFMLGPNGAGKTATLQALVRMFGTDRTERRIRKSDFHVADGSTTPNSALWIEAEFRLNEFESGSGTEESAVPVFFRQMKIESADGLPVVRIRLSATLTPDDDIEERFEYVLEYDSGGMPSEIQNVPSGERASIQVHYVPARRDPAIQLQATASALLGRLFRAADWSADRGAIETLSAGITGALRANSAIAEISESISTRWSGVHTDAFLSSPSLGFAGTEIEGLLRNIGLSFSPAPGEKTVDSSRLSDGQKSLLYIVLVLAVQSIGRDALSGSSMAFDVEKLRPPVFTIVAVEEPENSLTPHHLGRVLTLLQEASEHNDSQAVIATHAPSILRRVSPESIRYLRLSSSRKTVVKSIELPPVTDDAYKFIREAVVAYPELYFSSLVVFGEGASEEVLLPRLLSATGLGADQSAISVVPLGGRHVNHFWRLLHSLEIPSITLLDLDLGRHGGGWGRLKYAVEQLQKFPGSRTIPAAWDAAYLASIPNWNDVDRPVLASPGAVQLFAELEQMGVFFSSPLDLDFAMLEAFPAEFGVDLATAPATDPSDVVSVLGKSHGDESQYTLVQQQLFSRYSRLFKNGSKPSAHLEALGKLSDTKLLTSAPPSLIRLVSAAAAHLASS